MIYETVGYIKTLTISKDKDDIVVGFSPVGPYFFEDGAESWCVFLEKNQSVKVFSDVRSIMHGFKKDGELVMKVTGENMLTVLIAAKVNHSRVRLEVDLEKQENSSAAGSGQAPDNIPSILGVKLI